MSLALRRLLLGPVVLPGTSAMGLSRALAVLFIELADAASSAASCMAVQKRSRGRGALHAEGCESRKQDGARVAATAVIAVSSPLLGTYSRPILEREQQQQHGAGGRWWAEGRSASGPVAKSSEK